MFLTSELPLQSQDSISAEHLLEDWSLDENRYFPSFLLGGKKKAVTEVDIIHLTMGVFGDTVSENEHGS